ncbi:MULTISPECIES: hypothetical protein [unclassified Chelatococcus]|uniref:hypothetical protein n=1 Tax=unclassified Chelatococcus TaxID=2638111 RepID=UPI0020BD789F|nr:MULTISPECIES: hypothetical protein [unclassified Chelatococcus]
MNGTLVSRGRQLRMMDIVTDMATTPGMAMTTATGKAVTNVAMKTRRRRPATGGTSTVMEGARRA